MNRSQKKLADAVRQSLRATAAHGRVALDVYPELADASDELITDLRVAAREVARVSQAESPGAGRRLVDKILTKLDEKYTLTEAAPTRADRDASGALADRIVGGGSRGLNSAEDIRRQRQARAASERVDRELDGGAVAWKQD